MNKKHNLDLDRTERLGFPEVIYGAGKPLNTLVSIIEEYQYRNQNALITKLQKEKGKALLQKFPESFFDSESGIFILSPYVTNENLPSVGVITAGTSDIPVANEALYTLQFLGVPAKQINDIGVAGIHRLMNRIEKIKQYDILIVIAGFEGALPSVIGGMFPQPIIAVPTSTGYGAARNGETALLAMLSSCANGISVVNIDNGYGAAMSAIRIIQQLKQLEKFNESRLVKTY
jgi:NCAIR mutase (PurE)-related protein